MLRKTEADGGGGDLVIWSEAKNLTLHFHQAWTSLCFFREVTASSLSFPELAALIGCMTWLLWAGNQLNALRFPLKQEPTGWTLHMVCPPNSPTQGLFSEATEGTYRPKDCSQISASHQILRKDTLASLQMVSIRIPALVGKKTRKPLVSSNLSL